MRKGVLYIAFVREDSEAVGFIKKIKSQCKAFSNLGVSSYLYITTASNAKLYKIVGDNENLIKSTSYAEKSKYSQEHSAIKNKISSFRRFNQFLEIIENDLPHLPIRNIYFRRMKPITPKLESFLKLANEKNISVFYEFPDYPWYAPSRKHIFQYLDYIYDRFAFFNLKRHINKIVGISIDREVRERSTIIIKNGIDIETTPLKLYNDSEDLHLIGVANVGYWHAYDRVINGLKSYYNTKNIVKKKVFFHIVGDGQAIPSLKTLVKNHSLGKYVIFHGSKTGLELDEIMNTSDIGIGILGNHRKNLFGDSSLKNREYCARGLPFIIAASDYDFDNDFNYKLQVPGNEKELNILEIIEFYENVQSKDESFSLTMRKFAEENLTWEVKLFPVVEHFK